MCSQNDQRNVGIILSHVCWGRTPPPPLSRQVGQRQPKPPSRHGDQGGGGGVWANGLPCHPPPAKQFSSRAPRNAPACSRMRMRICEYRQAHTRIRRIFVACVPRIHAYAHRWSTIRRPHLLVAHSVYRQFTCMHIRVNTRFHAYAYARVLADGSSCVCEYAYANARTRLRACDYAHACVFMCLRTYLVIPPGVWSSSASGVRVVRGPGTADRDWPAPSPSPLPLSCRSMGSICCCGCRATGRPEGRGATGGRGMGREGREGITRTGPPSGSISLIEGRGRGACRGGGGGGDVTSPLGGGGGGA